MPFALILVPKLKKDFQAFHDIGALLENKIVCGSFYHNLIQDQVGLLCPPVVFDQGRPGQGTIHREPPGEKGLLLNISPPIRLIRVKLQGQQSQYSTLAGNRLG